MPVLLRRLIVGVLAVVGATLIYVVLTLPPRAVELDGSLPPTVVLGAYHVHSERSDGTGSPDRIAAAAAAAGLSFVILTDHGDGTRQPEPPAYLHGVLVVEGVELNTDRGHLVALGLNTASPYPLAGSTADVIADVHRQGGWVVAAHPDSGRQGQGWRGGAVGQDGIEWLNADTEWRDDAPFAVAAAAVRSLFRPAESVASLFVRPSESLNRWDTWTRGREVVGLAASDAHGGFRVVDEGDRALVRLPSYEAMFRTMAQGVVLEQPWSGEPSADGRALLDALRTGRTFSVLHALAAPAALEFTGSAGEQFAVMGERLDVTSGQMALQARVPQAPGIQLEMLHQGEVVATGRGSVALNGPVRPGAYRVEAQFPGALVPWIVSNPIYVGPRPVAVLPTLPDAPADAGAAPTAGLDAADEAVQVEVGVDREWAIEHDPASTGDVRPDGDDLVFAFTLGAGEPAGQFAALAAPIGGAEGFDRVVFRASASRPMRISLQLRLPGGSPDLRWRQSVYLGTEPTDVEIRLEDLEPVGGTTSQQPIVARIRSLLFVVDTVNTLPGASGEIRISDIRLRVGDVR